MVKPAGREADYSPSNRTEIKIIGDIPPLPLYDRMDYKGINFNFKPFSILSYLCLGLPCGLFRLGFLAISLYACLFYHAQ